MEIKALACEMPSRCARPLSRWSIAELTAEARRSGLVASISDSTVWRWLSEDAIRPWRFRSWLFPRDPDFAMKAGRILDLYHRSWQGDDLGEGEYVLSSDEKTSIQARRRRHSSVPARPGVSMRVEHEYERKGAWAYLAALDVHRMKLFGRCEAKSGIAPFSRLVEHVMNQAPYRAARRVFWIVDNGSSHQGRNSIARYAERYPNMVLVHGPTHASWLNQIEIYFSVLQRKALTPNNFASLDELAHRILCFQAEYERAAKPFEWRFTRRDLIKLLKKIHRIPAQSIRAAA